MQGIAQFLSHLLLDNTPLAVRRDGQPPVWHDAAWHRQVYEQNPQLYALLALVETIQPEQHLRILLQLLQSSREGMDEATRRILDRVAAFLLAIIPSDRILTAFLALRRLRCNHKHTTKFILQYITNHPSLEDLASCRRSIVKDSIEHAMGKNPARACAKMLSQPPTKASQTYLHRHLLRFVSDSERARLIFPLLYRQGTPQTGNRNYQLVHLQNLEKFQKQQQLPKTVTATNRGDIAATLVHLYQGGPSEELFRLLHSYTVGAASKLPVFKGKIALILDASASSSSYGEREFSTLSQSVALQLVLQQCCPQLQVYVIGGEGFPPIPSGKTDLALALLDALADSPDVVAIASDGYENYYPGDLQRVADALPNCGIETPVVFCHSKFTPADDLTWRRPAPNITQWEFWHQENFETLLLFLFSQVETRETVANLQEFLMQKLTRLEKELVLWTTCK